MRSRSATRTWSSILSSARAPTRPRSPPSRSARRSWPAGRSTRRSAQGSTTVASRSSWASPTGPASCWHRSHTCSSSWERCRRTRRSATTSPTTSTAPTSSGSTCGAPRRRRRTSARSCRAPPVIVVTGCTGYVGRLTAEELARRGHELRLLARDPARAPTIPGAEVVAADYGDRDSLARALHEGDRVFMVSLHEGPERRMPLHRSFIEAAAGRGVAHVVYLSFVNAVPARRSCMRARTVRPRRCSGSRGCPIRPFATACTRMTSPAGSMPKASRVSPSARAGSALVPARAGRGDRGHADRGGPRAEDLRRHHPRFRHAHRARRHRLGGHGPGLPVRAGRA